MKEVLGVVSVPKDPGMQSYLLLLIVCVELVVVHTRWEATISRPPHGWWFVRGSLLWKEEFCRERFRNFVVKVPSPLSPLHPLLASELRFVLICTERGAEEALWLRLETSLGVTWRLVSYSSPMVLLFCRDKLEGHAAPMPRTIDKDSRGLGCSGGWKLGTRNENQCGIVEFPFQAGLIIPRRLITRFLDP